MRAIKFVALVLTGVMIMCCLFGCGKAESSSSSSEIAITRNEIEGLTFEAVNELNRDSELGDYLLLNPLPYPMQIPGGGTMNQDEDSFDCYPYAGDNYITRIFLSSNNTNVFGISNGQTEADAEDVIQSRGYQRLTDDEASKFFLANETGVAYSKYDISVAFRFSSANDVIDKIIIVVSDPTTDDITH